MTKASTEEYTEAVRGRYLKAVREGKGRILGQFTQLSGYQRKAAIRLLHRDGSPAREGDNVVSAAMEASWWMPSIRPGKPAIVCAPRV